MEQFDYKRAVEGFCLGFTAVLTLFNWLRLVRIEKMLSIAGASGDDRPPD